MRSTNGISQEDVGDGNNSADMRDAPPVPLENNRPPEGCTTLSLDLLRQLRERGGTLTGLELIVLTDGGDWLKARVQKCDSDFKKVCPGNACAGLSMKGILRSVYRYNKGCTVVPRYVGPRISGTLLTARFLPL